MKKKWQQLRTKTWFKWASNKYLLGLVGFLIWMTFLDVNSFIIHYQQNRELNELEESIVYYKEAIANDKRQLNELSSDPAKLEKFAREEYRLHKEDEQVYLIEFTP